MKNLARAAAFLLSSAAFMPLAHAAEPDGLVLPPGFHANVVGDVGPHARHIVVGPNGDLYISTIDFKSLMDPTAPHGGVLVVKLDGDHKLKSLDHFGNDRQRHRHPLLQRRALCRDTGRDLSLQFSGHEEIPSAAPEVMVDGMPTTGSPNRGLAFDNKGDMFVSVPGASNNCEDKSVPPARIPKVSIHAPN